MSQGLLMISAADTQNFGPVYILWMIRAVLFTQQKI